MYKIIAAFLITVFCFPAFSGIIQIGTQTQSPSPCKTTREIETYFGSATKDSDIESIRDECGVLNSDGSIGSEVKAESNVKLSSAEIKMTAGSLNTFGSGNVVANANSYIFATLYFDDIKEDTTISFDLNTEGQLSSTGKTTANSNGDVSAFMMQDFWFNRSESPLGTNSDFNQVWSVSQGTEIVSDLTTLTYDLTAGTESVTFQLSYLLGTSVINDEGQATGDFLSTSWFNIRLGDNSSFTSSFDNLLTAPRDNLSTVSAPGTIYLAVFGLVALMVQRSKYLTWLLK